MLTLAIWWKDECTIHNDGQEIPRSAHFCYLESSINQDGGIEEMWFIEV